ncbi:MAG: hypothetical protein WCO65_01510 [bacterium]
MKKQIVFLAVCCLVFLSFGVTNAQNKDTASTGLIIPIETTKYAEYIPPAPSDKNLYTEKKTNRYDRLGRLIMQFIAEPAGYINVYLYDYDNNGNRIKTMNIEINQDTDKKTTFYLIKFSYVTSEYDKRDAFVRSLNYGYTPERLVEITQKIADRLDQK